MPCVTKTVGCALKGCEPAAGVIILSGLEAVGLDCSLPRLCHWFLPSVSVGLRLNIPITGLGLFPHLCGLLHCSFISSYVRFPQLLSLERGHLGKSVSGTPRHSSPFCHPQHKRVGCSPDGGGCEYGHHLGLLAPFFFFFYRLFFPFFFFYLLHIRCYFIR